MFEMPAIMKSPARPRRRPRALRGRGRDGLLAAPEGEPGGRRVEERHDQQRDRPVVQEEEIPTKAEDPIPLVGAEPRDEPAHPGAIALVVGAEDRRQHRLLRFTRFTM